MTLEEKAWQMAGDEKYTTGGLQMLLRYNSHPLPAGKDAKHGIPALLFADGPRGVVMGRSTCFPVSMARGATWNPDLERRVGNAIGIEARAQGANFYGGVCINLLRHPAWGRAQETYGEDPCHLGKMGVALVQGAQQHVMACAKHYACNSIENARFKVDVRIDDRALHEIYLPHFKACVDAGVASIMSAYNKVNGEHCGHNARLLRTILKDEWGFTGFVVSDFNLGIRSGQAAITGGLDIEMPFQWHLKPGKVARLVRQGKVNEAMIDDAATRIVATKLRFQDITGKAPYSMDQVACKAHVDLAREVALESIVLLKHDPGVLPIDASKVNTIAVIGELATVPNTGDKGSSRVYPPHVITALQGIEARFAGKRILHDNGRNHARAARTARDADVAIVVAGYTHRDEGEFIFNRGGDRSSLGLRERDVALIESVASGNASTVVVLEGGGPIITRPWDTRVTAILMAWYPGMEGGNAIASILAGDANPSGRMPAMTPLAEDHLPFFDKNAKSIEYDLFHGYRLADKKGWTPVYPFGWGASYTMFTCKNLQLDAPAIDVAGSITASVDVSNTGSVAGANVIQVYVGCKDSPVERPVKELKTFQKVHLAPGETRRVSMAIHAMDLARYEPGKGRVVDRGACELLAGTSSMARDLLAAPFTIG